MSTNTISFAVSSAVSSASVGTAWRPRTEPTAPMSGENSVSGGRFAGADHVCVPVSVSIRLRHTDGPALRGIPAFAGAPYAAAVTFDPGSHPRRSVQLTS